MTDSKTIKLWLTIFAIAFVAVFAAAFVEHYLNVKIPLLSDFLTLLGVGGGGATARNIVTDGIMPPWQRVQQSRPLGYPAPPGAPNPPAGGIQPNSGGQ